MNNPWLKLSDLDILEIGNTIQIVGAVYEGGGRMIVCLFPEDRGMIMSRSGDPAIVRRGGEPWRTGEPIPAGTTEVQVLDMDAEDWTKFLRQTDVMETEILTKASDGTLAKAIYRKSQRQIDSVVSWKVFKRDRYCCRYCGNDDIPLTVDHLVRWEEGGPTITDNLVASCKKCNKVRGNSSYEDWMRHPHYVHSSKRLTPEVRDLNEELIGKLRFVPRNVHIRSR